MSVAAPTVPATPGNAGLASDYHRVRRRTLDLAAPLSAEDAMVQSMPEASPAKWHLAHTTWFFERFVLREAGEAAMHPDWDRLFNSYYHGLGGFHPRQQRGLLSRPSLQQVLDYRAAVDERIGEALDRGALEAEACQRLVLGLHHEQQHQELLLTDAKHVLWSNPLQPAYDPGLACGPTPAAGQGWHAFGEVLATVGAAPWPGEDEAFAYDNESPPHRVFLAPYRLARRPVSNAEYRDFIRDGGYRCPQLWLSDGWDRVQAEEWSRPLYWAPGLEAEFTLAGTRALDPHAPVVHLSAYEADAFARWAGARLPTEFEWEHAARELPLDGNFADQGRLHPGGPVPREGGLERMFGDAWEWTSSSYAAYPGFRTLPGAAGEYNGKFMSGQLVLRGGSCATPRGHVRASYRNFFPPWTRWQFGGLRLAADPA